MPFVGHDDDASVQPVVGVAAVVQYTTAFSAVSFGKPLLPRAKETVGAAVSASGEELNVGTWSTMRIPPGAAPVVTPAVASPVPVSSSACT